MASLLSFQHKLNILNHISDESAWRRVPFPAHIFQDPSRFTRLMEDDGAVRKVAPVPGREYFLAGGVSSGSYFNAVDFSGDRWGSVKDQVLVDGVKLVVALDCGVEPDLKVVSFTNDPRNLKRLLNQPARLEPWQSGGEEFEAGLAALVNAYFSPVKDSTDFNVGSVDIPRRFAVTKEDAGYRLWMAADERDAVITQGEIYRFVLGDRAYAPSQEKASASFTVEELIRRVEDSASYTTGRGGEWQYSHVSVPKAVEWAEKARRFLDKNLHMPAGRFGVLAYSPGVAILTVHRETFKDAAEAYKASRLLAAAIMRGQDDPDLMAGLLQKGADFKYVDPDAARAGQSFASLMARKECFGMLARLKNITGVHQGLDCDGRAERPDISL